MAPMGYWVLLSICSASVAPPPFVLFFFKFLSAGPGKDSLAPGHQRTCTDLCRFIIHLPSGKLTKNYGKSMKINIFHGKIHYKW